MKKIICIVSKMDAGGAETFLMKMYRNIDRQKYQFHFIVSDNSKGFYDDEIKSMGGRILYSPMKSENFWGNIASVYRILKSDDYYGVLKMGSHSLATIELLIARFIGIKKIILRSTNADNSGSKITKILHNIFIFLPKYIPNVKIAPSDLAAKNMFGDKCLEKNEVVLLKNGLNLREYRFDVKRREILRNYLGINNSFVIGHIGRFSKQKNHEFLINVFNQIQFIHKDVVLLLIGKGELEDKIKESAKKYGIYNKIKFLGVRSDVPDLLMAMDAMLFPSLYEGMPNVVIEAQAAGVPCIISDKITKQVVLTPFIKMESIGDKEKWVECFNQLRSCNYNRDIGAQILRNKGYDIEDVTKVFENLIF